MAKLLTMLNENHQEKNSTLKSSPNLTVLNLHSRMIFTTSLRHSVLSTVFMSDWTTPRLPRCLVGKRGDWKKYCEGLHQSTKEIKSRCCFERSETALVAKHPLEPKSTLTGSRWLTLTNVCKTCSKLTGWTPVWIPMRMERARLPAGTALKRNKSCSNSSQDSYQMSE